MEERPFDPGEHRLGPTHWFEDLRVGQRFYINSRTQTEALFGAYQLASGDNHRSTTTANTARRAATATCWHTGCKSPYRVPPGRASSPISSAIR
jgi:hypothetical protein